ncbi:MAG: hypothetical protein HZY74_09000 [Brevundimonas sp.]|nr:MAG: hypothetical protein HZY74_09000 [Brevundimonas sp.]
MRFTAPKGGRYVVRAQALGGDETGAFELSLTELPPAPPAPEPRRIRVGESISGVLDLEDPIEGEERPYEAYAFDAQAGDRFTIRMTSATIDSYVQVGRQTDTGFEELANNDDDPTGDTLDSVWSLRPLRLGPLSYALCRCPPEVRGPST